MTSFCSNSPYRYLRNYVDTVFNTFCSRRPREGAAFGGSALRCQCRGRASR